MQLVWYRIWTRVAVSISYDDDHYTTGTSIIIIIIIIIKKIILFPVCIFILIKMIFFQNHLMTHIIIINTACISSHLI